MFPSGILCYGIFTTIITTKNIFKMIKIHISYCVKWKQQTHCRDEAPKAMLNKRAGNLKLASRIQVWLHHNLQRWHIAIYTLFFLASFGKPYQHGCQSLCLVGFFVTPLNLYFPDQTACVNILDIHHNFKSDLKISVWFTFPFLFLFFLYLFSFLLSFSCLLFS